MQAKEREIQGTAHKVKEEYTATSWETESKMINMQREHIEQCNRLQEVCAVFRFLHLSVGLIVVLLLSSLSGSSFLSLAIFSSVFSLWELFVIHDLLFVIN